jgi:LPXTG-site transpeptidase (sortase) family protein
MAFEKLLALVGTVSLALGAAQLIRFQTFQLVPAITSPKTPVLGKLVIPRIHLSLPILDNDDPTSLSLSVGHIPGTSVIGSLGNAGIAGHRDTAFRPLRNIRLGDLIETHTGQDAAYVVKTIRIVDPNDVSLLRESSSPLLTLVTCYPFDYVGSAPYRFVIQAQMTAAQEPTFTTSVKVVSLLATVKDRKGELYPDLQQTDFQIFEDGRPQTIKYFARQSDLPLTLGLLIDTSMSQEHVLDAERSACFRFLDQVLRPNQDKVFITQFDSRIITRQELTGSWKDLNDALSQVNTPSRSELSNNIGTGTRVYDTVADAAKIMQPLQGRKAAIILSDGDDNDSEGTLEASIDASLKADMLIYSILFGGTAGEHVLQRLSAETGGAFFAVSKKQSIDQIFDRIQTELRSQYNLGYVSNKPVDIPEFRKLQVKLNEKNLTVQTRTRYWATP